MALRNTIYYLGFAALIFLAWYVQPFFIFLAFVPIIDFASHSKLAVKGIIQLLLYLFTWNYIVTYWLCDIDFKKGILVFFLNSLLMSIPFLATIFSCSRMQIKSKNLCFGIFLLYWIAFEYFHHLWDLSWPWLTIGNVFASKPVFVNWYFYTGVMGGSVWILVVNFLVYKLMMHWRENDFLILARKSIIIIVIIIGVPIIFSLFGTSNYKKNTTKRAVIITTSFTSKNSLPDADKLDKIFFLLNNDYLSKADYLIIPELFLNQINRRYFKNSSLYIKIKKITESYPNLKIVIGANLIEETAAGKRLMKYRNSYLRYNSYNVAICIDSSFHIPVKQKKIFIPFEEFIPAPFSFINYMSSDYSFDTDNNDSFVYDSLGSSFLTLICYEGINTSFVAKKISNSDKFIVMLASEAFFNGNTDGMKQYLNIARLRAIETGKYLIKVSNSGISAVINPKGQYEFISFANGHNKISIVGFNEIGGLSFYVRLRAIPGKIIIITSLGLILVSLIIPVIKKFQ